MWRIKPTRPRKKNQTQQPMRRPTSILLIDDDLMVRQALGEALAEENYQVIPVANRIDALREIERRAIDIVLLDLNPRRENGWETLRRITALQPCLPVVAMTARPEQHEPNAYAYGVDLLLEKPLNLFVLIQALDELASQARGLVAMQHPSTTSAWNSVR